MTARADDMVTQPCGEHTDLLCVACGWQGHAHLPTAPWVVFMNHACRPVTCGAQYGQNPDRCHLSPHTGTHSNRHGTTWEAS